MLDALRRGSTGWVAKILLALLVLSFAIWGVADVFTGYGRGSVATVGDQEIRAEDFQRAFQNELTLIKRQAGRNITTEEARAAGLDNRVLAQLIAWAAVEQHASNLGLALSDEAIVKALMNDPAFKGPDDKFSRAAFENIANQMGLNERGFVALRRRDELRALVTSSLIDSVAISDAEVELLNSWQEEKRVAEHFTINADEAVTVPEPDEAKLKQTYEQNKAQFMAPEYRKLAVLAVSVDSLKDKMDVSDEEIKASYADTKKDYNTPEKRRVQQIAFKDKAAAEAAKKAIKDGKGFGEVAKEAGAQAADIDLGLITKDDLIDPKIADVAFSLKKDEVSDVVEGRFATVLLRATDIREPVNRTLDDVKDKVRDKVAREKASSQLQSLIDQVEENRNLGKPLKEIAEELKLKFLDVPAADRSNNTPDNKLAIALPDASAVLQVAFQSGVGLENDPVELREGGYAWVDVLGVTEPKQKPFDAVKEDVKMLAIDTERARLISELADKLIERAKNGEAMEALAKEAKVTKVDTTPPFTRSTTPHGMSKDAVAKVFTLDKGAIASAPSTNKKSRTIFKVTEVKPAPPADKQVRERIVKELKDQITDEMLSQYVVALQEKLGTKINEAEYRRVTGADTQ